jgi:integrase
VQDASDTSDHGIASTRESALETGISASLWPILNAALEDGLIAANPASRVGKFIKSENPAHQASAMTRDEAEKFLAAVDEVCPEWRPFFLMALRTGMRKGELIAVKWGDIQLGDSAEDPNRYILVQRNWSHGHFTTPKSKKPRRVDLSKELRAVLIGLRDIRLLAAVMNGKTSIADELVFPSRMGTVLMPDNIAPRYMEPTLEKAGLPHFRFHDLRHSFGSLLIQDGASLAYVKEQMGHSSIQITVDTYRHLIPGADIAWVDRLDSSLRQQQTATKPQQVAKNSELENSQVTEKNWLPPRDSNPDMLIQSQLSYH